MCAACVGVVAMVGVQVGAVYATRVSSLLLLSFVNGFFLYYSWLQSRGTFLPSNGS